VKATMIAAVSAGASGAQFTDTARCDSIIAAARVDSTPAGLFIFVRRIDGELPELQPKFISDRIQTMFVPPRPFRLTVFSGPARMRTLRPVASDTVGELRAPTVVGVYRFTSIRGQVNRARIVRASLMPGFDSAATAAIVEASLDHEVFSAPTGEDSMTVDVWLSSDSMPSSRRIVGAQFPRMRVVDAVPRSDNPPAVFPDSAKAAGILAAEVVLRFVVDRTGAPEPGTVELLRSSGYSFARAAFEALPKQRFQPATIRGCAVAQTVDYSFSFVAP
jgi:TonB family protein